VIIFVHICARLANGKSRMFRGSWQRAPSFRRLRGVSHLSTYVPVWTLTLSVPCAVVGSELLQKELRVAARRAELAEGARIMEDLRQRVGERTAEAAALARKREMIEVKEKEQCVCACVFVCVCVCIVV